MRMPKEVQTLTELMTTAEVADEAKVDVATVNRWARSGRLEVAKKLPGATGANLFHRADVEALLRQDGAA